MKKIIIALIVFLAGFVACKKKSKINSVVSDSTVVKNERAAVTPDLSKDTTAIKKLIMDFYTWYNSNYAKLEDFKLYKGKKPPYKMDWPEVDRMHTFIRNSIPQLGETFIKNQTRFLQQCDSAFKEDVNDEIPYGFDWDWYTNSQEDPQYILDELKKSNKWLINVAGNHATTDVRGNFSDNGQITETSMIKLELDKEGGTWKISKIGTD